jgi:hypothetical protein
LSSEQYGFVFAVIFITVFAGLTAMIPVDLQGQGATANIQVPVDPGLVSDFTDSETFTRTDFSGIASLFYIYDGDANTFPYTFECDYGANTFYVGAHILWFGLWLGAVDYVNFVNDNGTIYDMMLTFTDIDNDVTDGTVRYNLIFTGSGQDAGGLIFYYNTTTYTSASDAWDGDELYLIHGYGITPNTNIISLLVGILFLQLPDVPVGINLLIATPPWASIIYIIWFLIKESLPFF